MIKIEKTKAIKVLTLFVRTFLAYLVLFQTISVFVAIDAMFKNQSFIDTLIYWLPANLILALVVTFILAASDYFSGRLKEKLK